MQNTNNQPPTDPNNSINDVNPVPTPPLQDIPVGVPNVTSNTPSFSDVSQSPADSTSPVVSPVSNPINSFDDPAMASVQPGTPNVNIDPAPPVQMNPVQNTTDMHEEGTVPTPPKTLDELSGNIPSMPVNDEVSSAPIISEPVIPTPVTNASMPDMPADVASSAAPIKAPGMDESLLQNTPPAAPSMPSNPNDLNPVSLPTGPTTSQVPPMIPSQQ